MDKELNEFGNPYPTLSEMSNPELYKGTFSYQAKQLGLSLRVLMRAMLGEFAKYVALPIFQVFDAIAKWAYPNLYAEFNLMPIREFITTTDGATLFVEDAPALEIWRDDLCFNEHGVCVGRKDKS